MPLIDPIPNAASSAMAGKPPAVAASTGTSRVTARADHEHEDIHPVSPAITAFAGGGQASATVVGYVVSRVTVVASANDSVKLPVGKPGQVFWIVNETDPSAGGLTMALFPATGERINGLAANASVTIASGKVGMFVCSVAGRWSGGQIA